VVYWNEWHNKNQGFLCARKFKEFSLHSEHDQEPLDHLSYDFLNSHATGVEHHSAITSGS